MESGAMDLTDYAMKKAQGDDADIQKNESVRADSSSFKFLGKIDQFIFIIHPINDDDWLIAHLFAMNVPTEDKLPQSKAEHIACRATS